MNNPASLAKETTMKTLDQITLSHGGHISPESGMCAMEAAAYIANEPHSDSPQCVCPIITTFMVQWNDSLPSDDDRNRLLRPLIPLIIGTRATKKIELKRSQMALNWLLREYTPAWLDAAGLKDHATALRVDPSQVNLEAASKSANAALAAAWSASWDAALADAWSAAGAAAGAAAWSASWSASWDAALADAWSAAGAAAGAAAGDKLAPTVFALQLSAVELVKRMALCK